MSCLLCLDTLSLLGRPPPGRIAMKGRTFVAWLWTKIVIEFAIIYRYLMQFNSTF